MSAVLPIPASAPSAPVPAADVPDHEYARFLAALPEHFRQECQARLTGAGFEANHPVFQALAELYEKAAIQPQPVEKAPAHNFIEEAMLHANQAKEILDKFKGLPEAILAQIQPQLIGLLSALSGPVAKLESTAASLDRNVEALPILLLRRRSLPCPPFDKWWDRFALWLKDLPRQARWALSDHIAWIVCGTICTTLAIAATATVLSFGASHLARDYESAYQDRLAHMEADSAQNTVALNRLLAAGITIKYERSGDNTSHFLILQGVQKAAQPVNSPEGLAVQVWP